MIDEEVRRLIEEAEQKATYVLDEKYDALVTLGEALLEYETLTGDEVAALLRGEPIYRPDSDDDSPSEGHAKSSVPPSGASPKGTAPGGPAGLDPEPQPES